MKRYSILLVACVVVMLLSSVTASHAVFPNVRTGLYNGVGDGCVWLQMYQGWYMGQPTWYIRTETNSIDVAKAECLTFTPKLASAIAGGAPFLYVVTNFQQGPIFTTRPGAADYSGLWIVRYITWNEPTMARPITNSDPASDTNPYGIPGDQVTIADQPPCVCYDTNVVVVDYPVIAVGQLNGPWNRSSTWDPVQDPLHYRLQQVCDYNPYCKGVALPFWWIWCDDPITNGVSKQILIMPDVSDPALAALIKANLAPNLANVPEADTQSFWWFLPPMPPKQLPVIEECPVFLNTLAAYFQLPSHQLVYSPVMNVLQVQRGTLPPWIVVNNENFLLDQVDAGGLTVIDNDIRVNAPVLGRMQVIWVDDRVR